MASKGYLKGDVTAAELRRGIAALRAERIAEEEILIARTPQAAVESLAAGDVLVVRSFSDCGCGSVHALASLLGEVARRGAYIRSLADPVLDTRTPAPDWPAAAATLCSLESLFRSERSRESLSVLRRQGVKSGRRTADKTRAKLGDLLRSYYLSDRSVRDICREQRCEYALLSRILERNGLPRRREVARDPTLNPFFGGKKTLRIRVDDDYMTIRVRKRGAATPDAAEEGGRRGRRTGEK